MKFNWEDFVRFIIGCGVICFCMFEVCTCASKEFTTQEKTTQELASHGLRRNSLSGNIEPIR